MRRLIKYFLCIGCLAWGLQSAWAFSLLGPAGSAGKTGGTIGSDEDSWQITDIGYNPLPNGNAPPFIGIEDHTYCPKNYLEGYRLNTPVLYYTFDADFAWFGANGEDAVNQALELLNGYFNGQTNTLLLITGPNQGILMGATNDVFNGPAIALNSANGVDKYSTNLFEFSLNSQSINYQAQALGLRDLKSETLALMMTQLGLADAVRYTWGLAARYLPSGATCTAPPGAGAGAAVGVDYYVIMRNYDIAPSSLTNLQYSPYINSELFSYYIYDNCGSPQPYSPPIADALEIPVDPLNNNPPVASGGGEGALLTGAFYTGLTRDDAAGLRYLLSTNNSFQPAPGYLEPPASGSLFFSTNVNPGQKQLLYTSNLNVLAFTASTNDPTTLQTLYPTLQFGLVTNYFSNVVSQVVTNYYTNFVGAPAGTPPTLVIATNLATNIVDFFTYTFGNVVTNRWYSNTVYDLQTIRVGPPIGAPAGASYIATTNNQWYKSNVVSGDFFIVSNGACGPNIIQILQTNLNTVTNTITSNSSPDGQIFFQNLISYSTNHVFEMQPCTLVSNAVADYQGIGRIQFIRVRDDAYDSLSQQFYQQYWITNRYTMVIITNGQYVTRTFQRVVTRPDIVFGGEELFQGNGSALPVYNAEVDTDPNFIDSRAPNLAGPGIIDPTVSSNISIVFNTLGPAYYNQAPGLLTGPDSGVGDRLNWASFDGTTNPPVLYPNGSSIANLAAETLIQISPPPPTLPNGTNGAAYNVALTAAGGQPPYTWLLTTNSMGLPPGLSLSSGGVVSGTPTQSGTFDNIEIQMTDTSTPPLTVQLVYSLTIN